MVQDVVGTPVLSEGHCVEGGSPQKGAPVRPEEFTVPPETGGSWTSEWGESMSDRLTFPGPFSP